MEKSKRMQDVLKSAGIDTVLLSQFLAKAVKKSGHLKGDSKKVFYHNLAVMQAERLLILI